MKIALLSFHNAANYGAALQAYALEKFLENQGYDCEYIDYQNERRRHGYDMGFQIMDNLKHHHYVDAVKYSLGAPFMNARKRYFTDFYRKYVKYSPMTYFTPESLRETNARYDCFVTGSDQIWNPDNNGSDLSFLLDFVNDDSKKIAYSSSLSVKEVPLELKDGYKRCFESYRHLSTREQSGAVLIKELTEREAKVVLDPVFLIKAEEWRELIATISERKKDPYIFSYTNKGDQMAKFLGTGYDMRHLKHHKLSRFTTPSDFINPDVRVKYVMSPIEFLQNINNAELVVSASFHCISFAIILNKPFVCFLVGDDGKDERLKTILTTFGLMDRVYSDKMSAADVMKPIDYESVNRIMEEKRLDSIDYLLTALKDVESLQQ